jgi:hypothetical protein
MRTIVVASALILLAGCGYYRWEKPGATSADFQRDSEACQQKAPQGQWQSCMRENNWHYASTLW